MQVVVADDHPLYREALSLRLKQQLPEAEIIEVGALDDLLALSETDGDQVELVLLDLCMPGMIGGQTVERVVRAFPQAAVVLVSGVAQFQDIRQAVDAGARGFLPKTMSSKHFAQAIEMIMGGGTFLPADTLKKCGPSAVADSDAQGEAVELATELTPRQQQVLAHLASGATNKEIGRHLDIAEVTVKLHIRQVLRKINARNRAEAVSIATRAGLI
jgi:DNA-binding NarL/FixJ family response regulator